MLRVLLYIVVCVALGGAVELPMAWITGVRTRDDFLIVALAQLVTTPTLMVLFAWEPDWWILLGVVAVVIKWRIYRWAGVGEEPLLTAVVCSVSAILVAPMFVISIMLIFA